MLKLCDISKAEVPQPVQRRGEGYWIAGRVRLIELADGVAQAYVRGARRYQVEVNLNEPNEQVDYPVVKGTCSCPYFQTHGYCKHLWAVLRAVDEIDPWSLRPGTVYSRVSKDDSPQSAFKVLSQAEWMKDLNRLGDVKTFRPSDSDDAVAAFEDLRFALNPYDVDWSDYLRMVPQVRRRLKNGEWGKWQPMQANHINDGVPPHEWTLALALIGLNRGDVSGMGEGVTDRHAGQWVPQIASTGKLYYVGEAEEEGPLAWDNGPPWRLTLALEPTETGYTLRTYFERDSERRPLRWAFAIRAGVILAEGQLGRFHPAAASRAWAKAMLGRRDIEVPTEDVRPFIESLTDRDDLPPLQLPAEVDFVKTEAPSLLELALLQSNAKDGKWIPARVLFHYGDEQVPAYSATSLHVPGDGEGDVIRLRDRGAEEAALAQLQQWPHRRANYFERSDAHVQFDGQALVSLVEGLTDAGWRVTAEEKLYRPPGTMKVSVKSGIDWFDLQADCDFGGVHASLPMLLKAARDRSRWVELDDGSYGLLPEEWLAKWAPLAVLGEDTDDRVRFTASQAGLLDAWLLEQPEVDLDARFQQMREQLRAFGSLKPAKTPSGFKGQLRPYQREGLGWLLFLQSLGLGGCLADDMGLGKTVQVLALLERRRTQRKRQGVPASLIVAPRSLIFNWLREAERFAPRLKIVDHTGTGRDVDPDWGTKCDVVLTTYGTLRRDIGALKEIEFDYVILDESQAIKNAVALTAKSVRLLKARNRLALSGTPIENHLGELWSLMEFLNPGLLGRSKGFGQLWGSTEADPAQRAVLARAMRPFILRRTKEQVATDLPERQEDTLMCALLPSQREQYDSLLAHYRQSLLSKIDRGGLARNKMHVLEALLRLRQAACHPGLVDPALGDQSSAKFEMLWPRLEELMEEGHRALIFSQFTSLLALLRRRLDAAGIAYAYLDGRTRNREACVERFQTSPDVPLFLISLKAGGLGLNLTAADYVFLLDPWWNPAVEAQAINRAHRIGQVNRVLAYRMIAADTIEEKVLQLQEQKRELADAILGEDNALIRNLTREDLEWLLT